MEGSRANEDLGYRQSVSRPLHVLSEESQEVSLIAIWKKEFPGRGQSKHKGPVSEYASKEYRCQLGMVVSVFNATTGEAEAHRAL